MAILEKKGKIVWGASFYRPVVISFLTQVALVCFSVATAAVAARWLGPEGKGVLGIAMLIPTLLRFVLSGGLGASNVYFSARRQFPVRKLVVNSFLFGVGLSFLGFFIVSILIFGGWLGRIVPGISFSTAVLACVGLPIMMVGGYLSNILQGLERFVAYNAIAGVQSVLCLVLMLFFVVGLERGVIGAILSYQVSAFLGCVLAFLLLRKEMVQEDRGSYRELFRETWAYGIKGHVANVFQFLSYRTDMFVLNYYFGAGVVGIYSVPVSLSELLWHFPNAVGVTVFPMAARLDVEGKNGIPASIVKITLTILTVGSVALVAFGKLLIEHIYSKSFLPGYEPMLVLLPGVIFLGGAKVVTNELAGMGCPHYNAVNSVLSFLVGLCLYVLLIPRYSMLGAALASSISYFVTFCLAWLFRYVVVRAQKLQDGR